MYKTELEEKGLHRNGNSARWSQFHLQRVSSITFVGIMLGFQLFLVWNLDLRWRVYIRMNSKYCHWRNFYILVPYIGSHKRGSKHSFAILYCRDWKIKIKTKTRNTFPSVLISRIPLHLSFCQMHLCLRFGTEICGKRSRTWCIDFDNKVCGRSIMKPN